MRKKIQKEWPEEKDKNKDSGCYWTRRESAEEQSAEEDVAETWHKMMTEEWLYSFKNQKEMKKRIKKRSREN